MVVASLNVTFKWEDVVVGCGVEFEKNTIMTKELLNPMEYQQLEKIQADCRRKVQACHLAQGAL